MLQKLRNHVALALVFFILTLTQQYGFYGLKGYPIIWLSFGKYLATFAFFLVFTLVPNRLGRFFVLSFLMIFNFFQMAHLSYYGTQILPNEIFLFFTEMHEVMGVLTEEVEHTLIPLLFTLIPLAIGFFINLRIKVAFGFKVVPVLLVLYFLYNPIRTYVTGNTWGRQPSTRELAGMNVYLSLSYFLGKILPHKLETKRYSLVENEAMKLKLIKVGEKKWDNIILVLGESLTPHHMSLYGYDRKTTPYLETLKKAPNFFHTIGLSSGVSTDVSVAFFMNLGYGDAGALKAAKGEHCLFRSAKSAGYSTHFFSSQSGEQLRYIAPYLCSAFLDDYRSLESISPATENSNAAIDRDMLPKLDELLKAGSGRFIILHQRGSHGPWALRATPEAQKFTDPNMDERVNHYDNSIVEFDLFWRDLNKVLENQKSKTLVVYVSDHGEAIGQKGRWGHGFLDPLAFEIPVLIQSFNQDLPKRTGKLPLNVPHYNMALYLTESMGWEINQDPFTIMKDFMIYGNDIDGFAGKAEIKFGVLNNYEMKPILE